MPKILLLDGNIYNRLDADVSTRSRLKSLIARGVVRVIATPMLVDELGPSPFCGLPDWFSIEVRFESVFALDYAKLDTASLGDGDAYRRHRGQSNKVADAVIADSAASLADVLVSDDGRCRKRLADIGGHCIALDYEGLLLWLDELEASLAYGHA